MSLERSYDADSAAILDFLRGNGRDWDGRTLSQIRQFTEQELEDDHHYIQWLFPLTTESEAVFAPVLSPDAVAEFFLDDNLQHEMLLSLSQMLSFFGFSLVTTSGALRVEPASDFSRRAAVWLSSENHNYRRVSRILSSLVLTGLSSHAEAFLVALEALMATEEGRWIDPFARWHWERAVRR